MYKLLANESFYSIALCSVIPCFFLLFMKKRPKDLKQFMILMAVVFLILGFFENIIYFVDYLPHKELYTVVDGSVSNLSAPYSRWEKTYASFCLNGRRYGPIPIHIGLFEDDHTTYRFGVRIFPSGVVKAVRIQPVLGDGTAAIIIWEIWGILMYLIKPAWEDE